MVTYSSNPHIHEMNIRRRMASIFNKREDEFSCLKDYNDYLEEVEDMIFNLVAGVNVHAIEEKIRKYQSENSEQIAVNQARKAEELAAALASSKAKASGSDSNGQQATLSSLKETPAGAGSEVGLYAPKLPLGQLRPVAMAPQPLPLSGSKEPHDYTALDEETARRASSAGGWSSEISKKRALEEAFASIWV